MTDVYVEIRSLRGILRKVIRCNVAKFQFATVVKFLETVTIQKGEKVHIKGLWGSND